jgi:agmatinase
MAGSFVDSAFTAKYRNVASADPAYSGALSFMRRKYSKDTNGADVVVWGIPFDAAVSNRPGARFGPQAIRKASAIFCNDPQYPTGLDLFDHLSIIDYGDCELDYGNHWKTPSAIEKQAKAILKSGAFLYSMGGDHFVTWPLLKAHAALHGPLAMVQFDAHQDTWFDDGKRIDHGSFVARAVRDGIIDPKKSIQIGIRTKAPEDFGIRIIPGFDVEELTSWQLAMEILRHVGESKAYLTFDVDCLDPAYAPGTGTPVSGGPSSSKMLSVLRQLDELNIVGSDIVEVAPAYDHAEITAIAGATVAMYVISLLAKKRAKR